MSQHPILARHERTAPSSQMAAQKKAGHIDPADMQSAPGYPDGWHYDVDGVSRPGHRTELAQIEPLLVRTINIQYLTVDGETFNEETHYSVDDDGAPPVVHGVVLVLANGTSIFVSTDLEAHEVRVSASDNDGRDLGKWTVPA